MAIRNDITINWLVSPRIIEVAAPSVDLAVQDLYDTLRSLGAEADAMDEPEIVDGSGKEVLALGLLVGLTVTLLNAKVKFEDRTSPTNCDISGGNLVAIDNNDNPMNPIQYSNFVTVTLAKSSSATIMETGVSGLTVEESERLFAIPTDLLKEDVTAIKGETDKIPLIQTETDKITNIKTETDKISDVKTETDKIVNIELDVIDMVTEVNKIEGISANLIDVESLVTFIKKVEGGKWSIVGDQMIFYDEDNETELMRFDITRDESGNPIMRTRVL